jgi:hypothetical protein
VAGYFGWERTPHDVVDPARARSARLLLAERGVPLETKGGRATLWEKVQLGIFLFAVACGAFALWVLQCAT